MHRIIKSLKEFNCEFIKSNTIKENDIYKLCNKKCKVAFVEVTILYQHDDMPRSCIFLDVDGTLKGFKIPLQMFFNYKHSLSEFIEEIDVDKERIYFKNRNKHGYLEKYYGDDINKKNDNADDEYNNSLDGQVSIFDFVYERGYKV